MPTLDEIKIRIIETAFQQGVSPALALAVARAESGFSQAALSPVGAIGIFQLMPATAQDLGVDPYNWEENIRGGVRYLKWLSDRYPGGRIDLVLAGYNWGPGNTSRLIGGNLQYPADQLLANVPNETRTYINRVLGYMVQFQNDPLLLAYPGGAGGSPSPIPVGDIQLTTALAIGGAFLLALFFASFFRR